MTRKELILLAVAVEAGLGVLAVALAWLLEVPIWERLSWSGLDLALGIGAAVPMLAVFFVCLRWPIGPLRPLQRFTHEVIQPLFRVATLPDLAIICLLAGIGEELFFRGCLQQWLERFLEPWAALVLAAVLFGLFHPINIAYVVLASMFGAYLGWLFLATENLLPPIVAHAVYDFVALVILVSRRDDRPLRESLGNVDTEAGQ